MRRAVLMLGLLWQFAATLAAAQSPAFTRSAADPVYDVQALRILAEQGDKRAAFLLASRYASARGVPRDDSEAVRWFTMAAEGGLAEAQYNLGIMYVTGRGVSLDMAKGAHWYERAAEQGLAEAQYNLGTLYGTGRGVRRDEALAVKWLTLAAQSGLARAQYNLGALYEHGRGVRVNGNTALQWYAKAAEQGLEQAILRRAVLAKKMQRNPQPQTSEEAASVITTASAEHVGAAVPAVRKDPPSGATTSLTGTDWLRRAPADQYTVQLASFTSRADAQTFVRKLNDELPVAIYATSIKAKDWFVVVRGKFTSHAAAVAAVARWPASLRNLKPWIRRFDSVQKRMN